MTPVTRKACPKNGQVQLRAHARAAFASYLSHRFYELSICNAVPYRLGACVSDQDYQIDDT